jgi:hypothetical protein
MSKPTKKKRYDWPPPVAPEDAYVPKNRNPIHSILTALPVIMLVVGLYVYYQGESEQSHGAPIRAESVDATGIFTGLSVVNSGGEGRHYLWFEQEGKARGVRVQPAQARLLETLNRGEPIRLRIAPTVAGSTTFWAWYIEQGDIVLLDSADDLQ